MNERKMVKAQIGPYPRPMPEGIFDPMPKIIVTFDDGETETLFSADEIDFTEQELIGLTEEEARRLRHDKDVAYLRAP